MNNSTTNIKDTNTYKLVSDEARYLSVKLQTNIFVIQRENTLYTSVSKEQGVILSVWNLGNEVNN